MCKSTPSKETFLWEADETDFLLSNSSIVSQKTQKVFLAVNWSPSEFSKIADTGIYLSKYYFRRDWGERMKVKKIENKN